jgi:hypothetical protein
MLSWPLPFVSYAVDFDPILFDSVKYRTYLLPSLQWPPASVGAATLDKMGRRGDSARPRRRGDRMKRREFITLLGGAATRMATCARAASTPRALRLKVGVLSRA